MLIIIFDTKKVVFSFILPQVSQNYATCLSFIELLHSDEDDDYLLRGPCVIPPFDSHSRAMIKVNI